MPRKTPVFKYLWFTKERTYKWSWSTTGNSQTIQLISSNTLDFLIFLSHKISSFCQHESECSVSCFKRALWVLSGCQPKQMFASVAFNFVSTVSLRSVKADAILKSVRCKREVEMPDISKVSATGQKIWLASLKLSIWTWPVEFCWDALQKKFWYKNGR